MEQYPLFTLLALNLLTGDREERAERPVPGHEADRLASLARSREADGTATDGASAPVPAPRDARFRFRVRVRPRRPAAVPAG
ncbi:hypothetical protein [Streptomyces sp. ST2-7A]|uniref:hypothetical protein n=1 Tax=Streptomyces sp. ST2-7A TaxID=2907214 RepID=UPI001F292E1B|nr:hypothetical protein [Streptomyces sp. ST2-7A]MCE7079333.1 hypothetical protein [Streptomyces sp. ST2-7A]